MEDIKLAAKLNKNASVIDLHESSSVQAALDKLESELFGIYSKKEKYCRIIHGIGTGVLTSAVQKALEENPLVNYWQIEENGGSCVVVF